MGRQFVFVSALVTLSILAAGTASAQGPRQNPRLHGNKFQKGGNGFRRAPARFFQMSPEERQTFKRNAERWLQMDPQQRTMLRERERLRRERLKTEAEAFLHESGLRLDNGAREEFEARYLQERRRIEQSLNKEIEAKRQQQVPELKERLKNEFQPHQASPAGSASPASSVKPGN